MDIHLMETDTNRVMNDTCIGRYDIGVLRIPENYYEMTNKLITSKNLVSQVLLEYRYGVAIHKSHPLARYDDIPYEELRQFPEICNSNNEPEIIRRASVNQSYDESRSFKKINVYDRGTQVSMLKTVKNSYMWVPPMSQKVLKYNDLVTRKCSYANNLNRDMIIYRKASENSTLIADCIRAVYEYADKVEGLEI
jgi:hypothetical protein